MELAAKYRALRRAGRRHLAEEDGAATVSWVALTAAVVAISAATLSTITLAAQESGATAITSLEMLADEGPSY